MMGMFQCCTIEEARSVVSIMKSTIQVFSFYVSNHTDTKNDYIIVVVNNIFIRDSMQDLSLVQYLPLRQ